MLKVVWWFVFTQLNGPDDHKTRKKRDQTWIVDLFDKVQHKPLASSNNDNILFLNVPDHHQWGFIDDGPSSIKHFQCKHNNNNNKMWIWFWVKRITRKSFFREREKKCKYRINFCSWSKMGRPILLVVNSVL